MVTDLRLACCLTLLLASPSYAAIPARAMAGNPSPLEMLIDAVDRYYPETRFPDKFAAQVQAESLWSVKARNTAGKGELGCGLSQITKVEGKFDAMAEARQLHPDLKSWMWADCDNPHHNLAYVVIRGKRDVAYWRPYADTEFDALAFATASYNRGQGRISKERTLCKATKGCDPERWFGHVAEQSSTGKKPLPGYSVSSFEINRNYVKKVTVDFRRSYTTIMGYPDGR